VAADAIESYRPLIEAINALEPELEAEDDAALRQRAHSLRQHVIRGEPLADLLEEAYALVREVSHRTIGLRPFDVQMAGGIVLHEGKVAEMQTGEGKTLAAVAPVFLHALAGQGAHVLTFNDYLARRDAAWMGPVYEFLGLTVGVVQEGMGTAERQRAYRCDITYLTAKEAGFDHLRDGLCLERSSQVHRPFHFTLVDEADSILIDEARIPLVIAGATAEEPVGLGRLSKLAPILESGVDFDTDEYAHNIFLTDRGAKRIEELLDCDNLYAVENVNLLAAVRNALHAEVLLRRDVDYIVRGGSVELVDELTGRVAENRHWPDGLQAAVEAKEGLRLGAEGKILGSITLQHFLQLYPHLCGMTATALPAAEELSDTYGLDVVVIPPNRPCIRVDRADHIFAGREAKDRAVIEEIRNAHSTGRPVLVGTASVVESERLAAMLDAEQISCQVLNAKNDEREAAIVAEAGVPGAVTISTNMAGRGTDIRLGGHEETDRDQVLDRGGLYLIGTHRHESRRIDDQLRGRSGRQGDPGSSRFFVSLEDDLLQRYGIERLIPRRLYPAREDSPIDSPAIRREVERAQRIIEGESANLRWQLYDYSTILEDQRRYVADWRQGVLDDPTGLELLEKRHPTLWRELESTVGDTILHQVASRLTLLTIDRCWSEYLTEMQAVRDEIHLVALDGREPLPEFYRTAIQAFERLVERIEEEIVDTFPQLEITADGVDWERHGLRGPSATWTYLVSDNVLGSNVLLTLANRPSLGLGAIFAYPILFVWGLYLHWQRRRKSTTTRKEDRGA
jgi:preprotein translocase subunit SecA